MLLAAGEGLSAVGSDTSLDIQAGRVAISIPIDRFSSVAYGLQRGDHVNIIASLLIVDIDTEFQTVLPNSTGGVIAPGNTIVFTTGGGRRIWKLSGINRRGIASPHRPIYPNFPCGIG